MQRKKTKKAGRVKKGTRYVCNECGLVVTIDEPCGCVDYCDLICCGEPMKPKRKIKSRKS